MASVVDFLSTPSTALFPSCLWARVCQLARAGGAKGFTIDARPRMALLMHELIGRDPTYANTKLTGKWTHLFLSLINDARDLPFIVHMSKIILLQVPFAVYLAIPGNANWALASLYWIVNLAYLMPPFILMLHNTSHRPLFKRKYSFLNKIIPWFLSPFFGQSPDTYHAHHISMHHPENNLLSDKSTTLPYQRDSILAFSKYFLRFFLIGLPEVSYYLYQKKRMKAFRKIILGELIYITTMIAFSLYNPMGGLVLMIVPFVFSRFAMMMGNWVQHAFVDTSDPNNCYKNSITCINTIYNRRCFNDGYHVGHHLKQTRHWTEMPNDFLRDRENYIKNKTLVFEKLDYFVIWFLLMTKRYKFLSNYFVNLDQNNPLSQTEVIDLIKERCQIHKRPQQPSNISLQRAS